MPELPEVEVVRLGLIPAIADAKIVGLNLLDERSIRRHVGSGESFVAALHGARFTTPYRRGKYLWLPLANTRQALVTHLGMSGQLLLRNADAPHTRHTRIAYELDQPAFGKLRIDFVDQRIFGSMAVDTLVPAKDHPSELLPTQVAHIARDPLDPRFADQLFYVSLTRRNQAIKRALLDQTLISGVGNIYADEALWASRIHPRQPAKTLPISSARTLLSEIRKVFAAALKAGGTSFDAQYVRVNGESGYFSRELHAYGRGGLPCTRCSTSIAREVFMNRSSHFCPHCQQLS